MCKCMVCPEGGLHNPSGPRKGGAGRKLQMCRTMNPKVETRRAMWDSPHGIDQTSLDARGKATAVERLSEFTNLHLHDFASKITEKDIRHGSPP